MVKFRFVTAGATMTIVFGAAAFGASLNPCPQAKADPTGLISGTPNTLYQSNVAAQGTCNLIITFNSNGSIGTAFANAAPYDGVEDQLIGVINNGSTTITSLRFSNPAAFPAIFDFETTPALGTDGICAYTPFASNSLPCNSGDPISGTYLGSASSFSGINFARDTGNVNFAGIAPGTTGYFSLEGPASLNLQVTNGVPEPGSISLVLLGFAAASMIVRRRKA